MSNRFSFAILALTVSFNSYSYVECEANVKEILPNINAGVWIELTDGTKVYAAPDKPGLDRNMSVALAAMMADKKVRILLLDGESCGVNSHENWKYVVAYKQ